MAKIVHLTSVHPARDIRIFHKECKTLASAGHEVVLIAPHSEPFTDDGVRLRPVPMPRGRRDRMTRTVWEIARTAVDEAGDVYHFHDPELIPVGLLLKRRGKRVVYDVHEDRPQQMLSKYWIPPRLRGAVARITDLTEIASNRVWDGVVVATPAISRRFPGAGTAMVQNFPMVDELLLTDPMPYTERPANIAYVGSITTIRGAHEMVAAMGLLPEGLSARLDLAGTFAPPSLERELQARPGWERVTFRDWLTRKQVASLLGRTRIGLVLLHPTGNYVEAQPNKLFEYMSVGVPVIASDFPHWRDLVGEYQCALLVDPKNPRAIADAIQWLLEHPQEAQAMGERGQDAVRDRFNWHHEAEELLAFYESMLARTAP